MAELPVNLPSILSDPDRRNYFPWLLETAAAEGLLPPVRVEELLNACGNLFAEELTRLTHGTSASVSSEYGERVMRSVIFSVSAALRACGTPDAALDQLNCVPLGELLQAGRKLVRAQVTRAARYLAVAQRTAIPCVNTAYFETLAHGFTRFFRTYEPIYGAGETPCDIDYPLATGGPELDGADYAEAYLAALCHENRFCRSLGADSADRILRRYCPTYGGLLVNLCLRLLIVSLGNFMAGGTGETRVDQNMLRTLTGQLAGRSSAQIEPVLRSVFSEFCDRRGISDGSYRCYLESVLPVAAAGELAAAFTGRGDTPERIFAVCD